MGAIGGCSRRDCRRPAENRLIDLVSGVSGTGWVSIFFLPIFFSFFFFSGSVSSVSLLIDQFVLRLPHLCIILPALAPLATICTGNLLDK